MLLRNKIGTEIALLLISTNKKQKTMSKETVQVVGKIMPNNASVTTAKVEQTAAPEIGIAAKTVYYMVIETQKGKRNINIGQKTYEEIKRITE